MSTQSDKVAVLGVTGSIAAYKACEIASLLVKEGVKVIPVLTNSARQFVGAASFEGLTGNPVITDLFEPGQNQDIEHVAISKRADLFLIAPATANILAKAARGIADDWLSTSLLVTRAPILFAPAMNTNMYEHAATQANLTILRERGCRFVGPDSGILACKTVGVGRMAEAGDVAAEALALLHKSDDLAGKTVLVTTGANHEPIDPVRFIGNRSSGKMGRAVADEALQRGAKVIAVTGPADVQPPPEAEIVQVETALQMHEAVMKRATTADVVIGVAAVSDYRVAEPATNKRKRNGDGFSLALTENPDIIAEAGARKKEGQIIVGFAAETEDVIENARVKLDKKHLDIIVANEVGGKDSGFGAETVRACVIATAESPTELTLTSKRELARHLFDRILTLMN